jgi:LysB family phage lysis regulatory protein
MTSARTLLYGLALVAALCGLIWQQQQRIESEQARADLATDRQQQAEQRNARQAAVIVAQEQALGAERAAQASLREQQGQLRQALAARQLTIEGLKRENAELRDWADQPLPAAARRLRERPAITGAAGYQHWLSRRDALPAAALGAEQ